MKKSSPTNSALQRAAGPALSQAACDATAQMLTREGPDPVRPSGAAKHVASRTVASPPGELALRAPGRNEFNPRKREHSQSFGPTAASALTSPAPPLPLSAIERTGVALWMRPAEQRSLSENDREYGRAFHAASRAIGKDILSGAAGNFAVVWRACRDWRLDQFDKAYSSNQLRWQDHYPDPATARTKFEATRTVVDGGGTMTPLGGDYLLMVDRAIAAIEAPDLPGAFSGSFSSSAMGGLVKFLLQHVEIHGETVPLTSTRIFPVDEGTRVGAPRDIYSQYGEMSHTPKHHLSSLQSRLEELFQAVRQPQVAGNDERMLLLAEMHWLLSHAMLDKRGSAAKSELAVRSIAVSLGMDLPPFREDFAPDLEAFLTPLDPYKLAYKDQFESRATMDARESLPVRQPVGDEASDQKPSATTTV